jgi:transcriptional regulator with XRE-family HTH domain
MGTKPRPKPERLAEKLLQIRNALGLSQTEMLKRLGVEDVIAYHRISEYETGKREPPLLILLEYARAANVFVDVLISDPLDLPERLPSRKKHEGIARASQTKRKR